MTLKTSLISSFNVQHGLVSPDFESDWWPLLDSPPAADLYLFMESDVQAWDAKLDMHLGSPNAYEFLARLDETHRRTIADQIIENTLRANAPVVALTSFLPEISYQAGRVDHEKRVHAIGNLLHLALLLATPDRTPVIQMVAGALITHLDNHFEAEHGKVLYAHQGDEDILIETILDTLSESLNFVSASHGNVQHLRIALELEPGPIYLLRDQVTLERFAARIEDHDCDLVHRCVGFNLDIAHWWLAEKITPMWLSQRASTELSRRIYHAHISGHSQRGHFGDYPLANIPPAQANQFKDWLKVLHDSETVEYVSLEFEAAPGMQPVADSARLLQRWIDDL